MDLDIGKLIASLGLNSSEFDQAMRDVHRQMQEADNQVRRSTKQWSEQFQEMGRKMQSVGKKMSMYLTLPLAGVGVGAFKLQKDFEFAMSKIVGLVGVGQDQVKEWEKDILRMAGALGKSPKELADAMFFVTSAGLRGAEALEVLEMAAKASVSGLGETKTIADLLTSAMNAYGSENVSAAQATDILVAAVREGKAEASELAESMGMVLPIASEMKVSFDQVGAAIAAMTRTGTDASMASTALRAILSSLYKPTEQAEKALGLMKTSSAELRKTIREDGLLAALQKLRELTSTNEEAMGQVIPNIRALAGVLDLVGSNAEDNAAIFERMTDTVGASDHAYKTASETMENSWQKAIMAGQVALVSLGKVIRGVFLPILEKLTDMLQSVSDWFAGLSDVQKKVVLVTGVLAAALGPLLVVLGKLMAMVAMLNPYLLLAGAITALATGVTIWARGTREAVDAQKILNSIAEESTRQYANQASEVEKLVWMIENENLSNEQRINAITRLKELMPGYNGYLTDEGVLIDHNRKSIDHYLESLKEKIRLQVMEEKMTKILRDQIEAQERLEKAQLKHAEALHAYETEVHSTTQAMLGTVPTLQNVGGASTVLTGNLLLAEKAMSEAEDEVESYDTALQGLKDTMEGLLVTTGKPVKPITSTGGGGSSSGATVPVELTAINALKDSPIGEINSLMQELANNTRDFFAVVAEGQSHFDFFRFWEENLRNASHLTFFLTDVTRDFGNQLRGTLLMGARSWKEYAQTVKQAAKQALAAQAAEAISSAVISAVKASKKVAEFLGPVGLAMIPVFITAAIGAVMTGLAQIPNFASGGLVYGDTLARVGEYPGAGSNPEVIAPLDKLKDIINPDGMQGQVVFRIEGDQLIGILDKQTKKYNLY